MSGLVHADLAGPQAKIMKIMTVPAALTTSAAQRCNYNTISGRLAGFKIKGSPAVTTTTASQAAATA